MGTIIYPYVGMSVGLSTKNMYAKMRGRNYVAKTHATQSQFGAVKTDLRHPYYSFLLYARADLAWTN